MGDVPAIELRGLVKHYGTVQALQGIDLRVERGEILGFLGPNGAGKSTTIRCLLDLIRPTAGQALVLGYDSQRDSLEVRRRTGYLPGELRLYDSLSGQQTVSFFASLRPGRVQDAYVRRLYDALDFDPSRPVGSYSRGNKQKLGIILALMHRPDVLILDEPTSGLDPIVQESVQDLLREASAEGRTVFFSSHVLPEVEQLCHRVAIIRRGRLVAVEEIANLKGRSLHIIEVTFAAPVPDDAFDLPGVREAARDGHTVHLEVRDNLDAAIKAIARFPVLDLRTEQPSLEQIFLAYYQGQAPEEVATHAAT